jgi:formyl-CoA transferase
MARPLDGVRIVDLSRIVAGPLATQIFGDYGAEVIKIEQPGVGDDSRAWVPPKAPDGSAAYFFSINRNKKSVTLNLKHPRGKALLKALVAQADVVIENFKPGTMEDLGLDYSVLSRENPRLIYCQISGFGNSGPARERAGYDSILQGITGLMSITGEREGPPVKAGVALIDEITALYCPRRHPGRAAAPRADGAGPEGRMLAARVGRRRHDERGHGLSGGRRRPGAMGQRPRVPRAVPGL